MKLLYNEDNTVAVRLDCVDSVSKWIGDLNGQKDYYEGHVSVHTIGGSTITIISIEASKLQWNQEFTPKPYDPIFNPTLERADIKRKSDDQIRMEISMKLDPVYNEIVNQLENLGNNEKILGEANDKITGK